MESLRTRCIGTAPGKWGKKVDGQRDGGPSAPPVNPTVSRNLRSASRLHPDTVFLSRGHARRHGSEVFVYNGLDPAEYCFRRFPKRAEQFDPCLGKLHSAKGYHWAVEAA